MQKRRIAILIILTLIAALSLTFASCDLLETHQHKFAVKYDDDKHWLECSCGEKKDEGAHTVDDWTTTVSPTSEKEGKQEGKCTVCQITLTRTLNKLSANTRTVDFYAVNDFHGAVDRMSQFGGYLKSRKNENADTVILNSGDMFQGSMESNSNYGKLLTDCMGVAGFDAFTFGNHEFDWGLDNLRKLANQSSVPFLGANIYKWNAATKQFGEFASDLAKEYEIKTLPNGLKVGIIGVIGSNQITSISSNLVQTIGFKDPLPIVKEVSAKLRNQHNCDLVVVSIHASAETLDGSQLDGYVDAVFSAHTHQYESGTYYSCGIPFIQSSSNGEAISHIQLSVDANKNVTCLTREHVYYDSSWTNLAEAKTLIDNSNQKIEEERNEVIAYFDGYMSKPVGVPRLVSRAIAEYATSMGHDITLAMVNTARNYLPQGNVTYSDLYEAIPFDNIIYIAEVSGEDLLKEAEYGSGSEFGGKTYANAIWRVSGEAVQSSGTYKIAIIDYLLFHQNANRDYDYFPSAFENGKQPVALTPADNANYNYRIITRQFLLDNDFNVDDYMLANNRNDNSKIRQEVTLNSGGGGNDGQTVHAGTLADPYDVSDALKIGAAYSSHQEAPLVYVKCVVCSVTDIRQSAQSGNLGGFYVTDGNGDTILVYYVSKSSGSSNWSSVNDLKLGDELVMYIHSYVYGGTPQLGVGYCVLINGEPA